MLIYNHNKEFIGIDNNDLRKLDLDSFADLLKECSDFADLFIKKPGYIHNFKNFKWIDFVMHSDSQESKVLISLQGKTYSAHLKISILHLIESPQDNSYSVELIKLHRLGSSEESIEPATAFESSHHIPTQLPSFDNSEATTLVEPDPLDVPDEFTFSNIETPELSIYNPESSFLSDSAPLSETKETLKPHDEPIPEVIEPLIATESEVTKPIEQPMLGDQINSQDQAYIEHLKVSNDYKYNPQIAADELGLPVDLIEEFIGDFILQANEFHDELFQSVNDHDFDNLKNLSHKLKGVAANLRIEDSFEVLNVVNITHDINEAEAYLKYFYNMVAKLEGKEPIYTETSQPQSSSPTIEVPQPDDDIYQFDTNIGKPFEPISEPDETLQSQEEKLYALDPLEKEADLKVETAPIDDELYALDDVFKDDTQEIEISEEAEEAIKLDEPIELDEPVELEEEIEFEEVVGLEEEPFNPIELNLKEDILQEEPTLPSHTEEASVRDSIVYQDLHYDSTKSAYELGVDNAFMEELKSDFITHALEEKDAIHNALENADAISYKQIALELKGISDNLRINDISVSLEELIKSNNSKEASQHVNQFFHYLVQL